MRRKGDPAACREEALAEREQALARRELAVTQKAEELRALRGEATDLYRQLVEHLPDLESRCGS